MSYYEESPVVYHHRPMPMEQKGALSSFMFSHPMQPRLPTFTPSMTMSASTDSFYSSDLVDSDIEDDGSLFEEDSRAPSMTNRARSQLTISTISEIMTPDSARQSMMIAPFGIVAGNSPPRPSTTSGPKGPHLFCAEPSFPSADDVLEMSPLEVAKRPFFPEQQMATPTTAMLNEYYFSSFQQAQKTQEPLVPQLSTAPVSKVENLSRPTSPQASAFNSSSMIIDYTTVKGWSAAEVGEWMYSLGFEDTIVDRFQLHDITGVLLLELKFEDLKELGIQSFDKRHQIWTQICLLRGSDPQLPPQQTQSFVSPSDVGRSATPSHSAHFVWPPVNVGGSGSNECFSPVSRLEPTPAQPSQFEPSSPSYNLSRRRDADSELRPEDSASIVAIEQLLPKPHNCSKGERCAKFRRQQRLLQRLQDEHGIVIPHVEAPTRIVIPEERVLPRIRTGYTPAERGYYASPASARPGFTPVSASEIGPSLVASSDLLGPGQMPEVALQEAALRKVLERDPQDNVKQFLAMQHIEPPRPVEETVDEAAEAAIRAAPPALPRLTIPEPRFQGEAQVTTPRPLAPQISYHSLSPHTREMTPPSTENMTLFRFGSPSAELPRSPLSRECARSVPPATIQREPVVRAATAFPSLCRVPTLPRLEEERAESVSSHAGTSAPSTPTQASTPATSVHSSPVGAKSVTAAAAEPTTAPAQSTGATTTFHPTDPQDAYPGVRHLGWVKKRKTKFLRAEWQDRHMRLQDGTLSIHQNALPTCTPVDQLNIDEYTVACSSQTSKLAAKLKNLRFTSSATSPSSSSFPFQLVSASGASAAEPASTTSRLHRTFQRSHNKTHNFSVGNSDERIEWMREIMLAKALRLKNGQN